MSGVEQDPARVDLVFDIETVSHWDGLSEDERAVALEAHTRAEARLPAELRDREENDPIKRAALSPWTGSVVSVALYEPAVRKGVVFYAADRSGPEFVAEDGFRFAPSGGERQLLTRFWRLLEARGPRARLVGFNSRAFDGPFLMTRSLLRGVPITRNLVPYRYSTREHLDLFDVLGFWQRSRVPSLEAACLACGIPTPKRVLAGAEVESAYRRGEILRVARYNADDVVATAALLARWEATIGRHFGERVKW